jgi:hypothetical protein
MAAWPQCQCALPVMDIALRRLPRPERAIVFGMDRPIYLSAHSEFGRLAPEGGAVVHLLRYLDYGRKRGDDNASKRCWASWTASSRAGASELVTRRFLRE